MYVLCRVFKSIIINLYYRSDATIDEHVSHQLSLVQKLNSELSQKKMIFSKNHIHLSKVVGQGLYVRIYIYIHPTNIYHCYVGESGLVYRGYLDSGGARDMVAIKTCKGKRNVSSIYHSPC